MAQVKATEVAASVEARRQGVGTMVFNFFLWLTFGWGSTLIYAAVGTWGLFFWTKNPDVNALGVLAGFSLYCFIYLIIQITSLLYDLYRTGGNMVRGAADIGTSLLPTLGLIVLATMAVLGNFTPTWLTYWMGAAIALTVCIDIISVLFYLRATQKTLETTAAH